MPGAASPGAAGGLQPRALPAQVSSPRVCSRQPELLACADAGPGPWGLKGSSVAQETGPPGRLHSVSEKTLQQTQAVLLVLMGVTGWAGQGHFPVEEAASEWSLRVVQLGHSTAKASGTDSSHQ